jgi:signal transduction histidine kinase/streptogramin lyase
MPFRVRALLLGSLATLALGAGRVVAQDITFRRLSVEDGLSHGAIRDIYQDRQGFMWFATEDGLNRYDGVSFKVLRHEPDNPKSLSSSNFGKLMEDRDGYMWYGTWGGGVNRYDHVSGAFEHFRHDPFDSTTVSQDRTEVLFQDRLGTIWVGTPNRGLNRFDAETETFVRYRHEPGNARSLGSDDVKAIFEDDDGRVWVGTNGGLSVLHRQTGAFTTFRHNPNDASSIGGDAVRSIVADTSGHLWIGSRGGGLTLFDPSSGRSVRHFRHDPSDPGSLGDDEVARVFVDSRGTVWVGTYDEGLNRFDAESGTFRHFEHNARDPRSLSHNRVESIYEDRGGVLWLGTVGGGIDILDLKPLKFANAIHDPFDSASLPHPTVRSLAVRVDSGVWVGTDGGGMVLLGHGGDILRRLRAGPGEDGIPNDRIWSLLPAGSDSLWIGSYGAGLGLMVESGSGTRFEHWPVTRGMPDGLQDPDVRSMARDRLGNLWLGTTNGLFRMHVQNGAASFERFTHDLEDSTSLGGDYINTVYADDAGDVWVGTLMGLDRITPRTGAIRHYRADPRDDRGLGAPIVTAILESRVFPGTLWIGTEDGGLNRLDPELGVVAHYLVEDGLASNAIGSLVEDHHGHLWISTSQGLSLLDPTTDLFTNYGLSDGLGSHSFMPNAGVRESDGRIYFGGGQGLTWFFPDSVRANPHVPPVVLTAMRVFDEEVELQGPLPLAERVVLPHDQNFLEIEFAALDYSAPEKNRYLFRMFGVDPEWIEAGNRTFANYPALAPGRYTFWVRASNNDGVWNHTGATIEVEVLPPWYGTWWFRLGSILGLGLAVVQVWRYRTRRIWERTQELEAINASLSDQILRRRMAEEERERLIPELEARNSELERFTYTVSHDLKSPLVTITGFLGMLEKDLDQRDDSGVARDVAQIKGAAGTMHQLLDELLDLSRAGRLVNPPTAVDLGDVAEEAVALLQGPTSGGGPPITILRDMPVVYGDRVRLLQVFQNLVHNAIKFSGGLDEPRIEIGARQRDDEWLVWVRDNGVGIDPAYHDKVFGLFDQLSPGQEGTGIGLALVKRIVEVHGGQVWVESEGEGTGCTFCFTLPVGRPTSAEWAPHGSADIPASPPANG